MIDRPNISTEYQPKGSARNQSDTLDRRVDPNAQVGERTAGGDRVAGERPLVDEEGRLLTGDGLTAGKDDSVDDPGRTSGDAPQ